MTRLSPTFWFSALLSLLHASLWGQSSAALSVVPRAVEAEFYKVDEGFLRNLQIDALDMAVQGQSVHMIFTDGGKLFYAISNNGGRDWGTEFVAYLKNEENQDPRINIEVGDRGTIHIIFPELLTTETHLWHYSRPPNSLGWHKEMIHQSTHDEKSRFDLDFELDCNNRLFLAYSVGGQIYYSQSLLGKWEHQTLPYGAAGAGCAILSGFDQMVYLAIAREQGELVLAHKNIHQKKWEAENVASAVYGECELSLLSDGRIMAIASPVVAGRDKPYEIWLKNSAGTWESRRIPALDTLDQYKGGVKKIVAATDPSGRVHLIHYFTNYRSPSNKSLAHLYSDDLAINWRAEIINDSINGYVGNYAPALGWYHHHYFLGVKTPAGKALLLKADMDRSLKDFPACLYRRNPYHDKVQYVKDTVSRIVDIPERAPESNKYHPVIRSNPNSRKTVNQGSFITSDSQIKLLIKDYQDVDGDTISVFLGDECVLYRFGLSAFTESIDLPINPEREQQLRIYAESEGSKPPCTVALSLKDSRRTQQYVVRSNLNENGGITLNPAR